MAIGPVEIESTTFYWGRSAVSGYATRLCYNEDDATAELEWLDDKWALVQHLWDDLFQTEEEWALQLAQENMERVMAENSRGMRPLPCNSVDEQFFRSDGPGEEPRIAIFRDDCPVMEVDGESPSDDTLQAALAGLKGYR